MKIIDISLPIDDTAFEVHPLKIERVSWQQGVEKVNRVLMGRSLRGKIGFFLGKRIIRKQDLPDGEFLSLETVHCPVHIGTHIDYSFHYGSMCEGRPSRPAEEIPLSWCYEDGVKIGLTHKKPQDTIKDSDVRQGLKKINYSLKPKDIVLFYTGADKLYSRPEYFSCYPGVDISAIDYLLDNGVKIFGVDTMGIDRPYKFMIKDFLQSRDASKLWPSHFYGRKRAFAHIERLANLDKLPDYGFKVSCFPIKIRRTGAAWARAVGTME
ncbi:MAG: cyclase family protein [Candidatus Omnitrophota bacterium]